MRIICHRGLWKKHEDQNRSKACLEGMKRFDGIEIDLKNKAGKIVLSHDPLKKNQKVIELEDLFAINPSSFYALNIKEDGLGPELLKLIKRYKVTNYMCFDLSSPEWFRYQKLNLKCFDRFGDYDLTQSKEPQGIVVDVFHEANEGRILKRIKDFAPKIPLFIISPELHHRGHLEFWSKLRNLKAKTIYLCTDFPEEAEQFFSSK